MTTPIDPLPRRRATSKGCCPAGSSIAGLVEYLRGPVRPRRQQVLERLAQDADPGSAEHDLECLVDPDHRAVDVDHDQAVGQRFDRAFWRRSTSSDALFEVLAGRDVAEGHDDPADRVVEVVGSLQLEVDLVAVGPTGPELQ